MTGIRDKGVNIYHNFYMEEVSPQHFKLTYIYICVVVLVTDRVWFWIYSATIIITITTLIIGVSESSPE